MYKMIITVVIALLWSVQMPAQRADYGKMSSLIRQLTVENSSKIRRAKSLSAPKLGQICAFVRTKDGDENALVANGCEVLAQFGDIYIANIPMNKLGELSLNNNVARIEASRGVSVAMDSMAININALPVYSGQDLPQAYTGKGVVMGIQDVGFDLTHPNFYSSDMSVYRIKRLWDMLSTDTVGSAFPVGNEYVGQDVLLNYAHSRDGFLISHGTHTLGIAAGSGYTSKYRGMAYESDICLVANAVSENVELIDSADYYKYTNATDALGFKYIFDYAESVGQPCVISFSEGSHEDFWGDNQLYYEVLESLTGEGKIIVASAGNNGIYKTYFRKPAGMSSAGSFIYPTNPYIYYTYKSSSAFDIRTKIYKNGMITSITIPTEDVIAAQDSDYIDSVMVDGYKYVYEVVAYPSCYNSEETAYDVLLTASDGLPESIPVSIEAARVGADVEWFMGNGVLLINSLDPTLNAGEPTHNINSPGGAPAVLCVGATSYRTSYTNYAGVQQVYNQGRNGEWAPYSSVGPTFGGLTKPDVMAPGTNIISSFSSFYLEKNPTAYDIEFDTEHFDYNGRTYAWSCQTGTSMASPAVGGAIALWLQADPTLTVDDVRDILSRTATQYDASLAYPNNMYGCGQIDVYAGLLEVLNLSGIKGVSDNQPEAVRITLTGGGNILISFSEQPAKSFSVRVYSTSGGLIKNNNFNGVAQDNVLNVSDLPHGVYVVQVDGGTATTTGSTLIRL